MVKNIPIKKLQKLRESYRHTFECAGYTEEFKIASKSCFYTLLCTMRVIRKYISVKTDWMVGYNKGSGMRVKCQNRKERKVFLIT